MFLIDWAVSSMSFLSFGNILFFHQHFWALKHCQAWLCLWAPQWLVFEAHLQRQERRSYNPQSCTCRTGPQVTTVGHTPSLTDMSEDAGVLLGLSLGGVTQAVGPVPAQLLLRLVLLVMRRWESAGLQWKCGREDELSRRAPMEQPGSLEEKEVCSRAPTQCPLQGALTPHRRFPSLHLGEGSGGVAS